MKYVTLACHKNASTAHKPTLLNFSSIQNVYE